MARKVYLHIGLPKTGTTYLQTILWSNRPGLRRQGLLLPGRSPRQHLWASAVVREDPHLHRRGQAALRSWDALVRQTNRWQRRAVISHEFFAGATTEQAAAAIERFDDAEVHLVLTARDTLRLVTGYWQEFVKHGFEASIDRFPSSDEEDPSDEWGWSTLDMAGVLNRWGAHVPPERVHVLVVPPSTAPRLTLWNAYADLLGVDPASVDVSGSRPNESLGVVEVELLRRVNADLERLEQLRSAFERGVWRREYLAHGKLVPRDGARFWPSPERVAQLRERGNAAVRLIRERGYHVVGDVEDLLVGDDLPQRRHPDSVTEPEMLAAATATIAEMLVDVRDLSDENKRHQEAIAKLDAQARWSPMRLRDMIRPPEQGGRLGGR